MISAQHIPKYYHYLLGFSALLIGAYSKWMLVGLLPLLMVTIYGWKNSIFAFRWTKTQWIWTLLYFVYVFYSLFYWNTRLSPQQIEYKLSWLIFPFLFSLVPNFKLDKKFVIFGFIIGVIIASILGIAKAIYTCNTIGLTLTSYTSSNISINHPTYFSASATIALLLIIDHWNQNTLAHWKKWQKFSVTCFLFLMILMSFSMAGFLFLAALLVIAFVYFIFQKRISILIKFLMLIIPISFGILISKNEFIMGEFNNTRQALNQYVTNPSLFIENKNQAQNGDEIRLIMWTASFMEISEHPMGVGPTKIGEHLSRRLYDLKQPKMAELNARGEVHYNPHNQYLQMALEIGWLPLLVFICALTNLFFIGLKNKHFTLSAVVLLLGFHCFFESILQRQSGIVTFTFFFTYFIFCIFHEKKEDIKHVE